MKIYKINYDDVFLNDIINFIRINDDVYSHSAVNINNNNLSLIEKIAYDTTLFHLKKMNMTLENKKISFWVKSKRTACLKCSHPHTDGDNYERNIYKNSTIKPLFTTLTYFNENDLNPTLITQLTEEDKNKKNFRNKDVSIIFPKKNLHVFFEGQTFIHCEANIFNTDKQTNKDRYLLIVVVWDNYEPIFLPFFNNSIITYAMFVKTDKKITQTMFDKNISFVTSIDESNKTQIVETNCLTKTFFNNLLFDDDDKIFKDLSCEITTEMITNNDVIIAKSTDTTVCNSDKIQIEKSDISMSSMNLFMKSVFQTYSIILYPGTEDNFKSLLDECVKSDETHSKYYLEKEYIKFNYIEKFIYENSLHDLFFINNKKNTNYKIEDIHVEYWFKSSSSRHKNQHMSTQPVLSSIIYLNNDSSPTIITNVDANEYKYKNFKNFNLFFSFPKRFKKIILDGGQYFHTEATIYEKNLFYDSQNAIVMNYWLTSPPSDLKQIDYDNRIYSKNENLLDFVIEDKCLKVEIDEDIVNNSFYQNILYNKSDPSCFKIFQKVFFDIEIEKNSNILLVSNYNNVKHTVKQSKLKAFNFFDNSTFIKQSAFNIKKTIPSFIDVSGCEFIKDTIAKDNINTELSRDISLFKTIETYLIEQNLFQKLVEKTIMYYNIEKTININIEKITINDTKFIKNIKNENNSIIGACLINSNEDDNYITFENNNLFEIKIGDLIFFNSEINFIDDCVYLLFFLNFYN